MLEEWMYLHGCRILGSAAQTQWLLSLHQASHQISGFRCEVGWQIKLGFQYGLNGFLAILGGEGRLKQRQERLAHHKLESFSLALTTPVSMSNMSAPSDHQSTALPWPLLVRISGALQMIRKWYKLFTCCFPVSRIWIRKCLAGAHAHVLNSAAEGVGDNTLLYVLLAQTKIC